jgi:hypothetical protein
MHMPCVMPQRCTMLWQKCVGWQRCMQAWLAELVLRGGSGCLVGCVAVCRGACLVPGSISGPLRLLPGLVCQVYTVFAQVLSWAASGIGREGLHGVRSAPSICNISCPVCRVHLLVQQGQLLMSYIRISRCMQRHALRLTSRRVRAGTRQFLQPGLRDSVTSSHFRRSGCVLDDA